MDRDRALLILERIANANGNDTTPNEDIIDLAQACLTLFSKPESTAAEEGKLNEESR
jgi:hypothetical protein